MKKSISAVIISFALGWSLGLAAEAGAEDPVHLEPPPAQIDPTPPPAPVARIPSAYQDLRPGQPADPALPLPPPPVPFDIRRQRTDGPWLGVTERELADGRLVEVHVSGSAQFMGQEVISRPTGHKVYRYYIGQPDAPRSGSDPAQDERNREDLRIIFGRDLI